MKSIKSLFITSRVISRVATKSLVPLPITSCTSTYPIQFARNYSKDKGGKDKKQGKREDKKKHAKEEHVETLGQEFDFKGLENQGADVMQKLKKDLSTLRSGRANPALLDPITVPHEGTMLHLSQIAQITVKDAQTLIVIVHQDEMMQAVDKAIRNSSLGLNPKVEDRVIKVPVPKMTQEYREELIKSAHKFAEKAKVHVRKIRQNARDALKSMKLTGDESRAVEKEIQVMIDDMIKEVDGVIKDKEKDLKA